MLSYRLEHSGRFNDICCHASSSVYMCSEADILTEMLDDDLESTDTEASQNRSCSNIHICIQMCIILMYKKETGENEQL